MKLTAVVVFYKQNPEQSKTFQTLRASLFSKVEYLQDIDLILYDNSPTAHSLDPLGYEGISITYQHDPRNLGIATAYNYAWSRAKENNSDWLLLFDHDTEVTVEYIDKMLSLPTLDQEVAAVVPRIMSENVMISPVYSHSLRPLQLESPKPGIQEKPVMAINSGALIRTDFLTDLNGFNKEFPLDYLDHWLFYEIYRIGKKVFLLDVTLEHELSVMDYSRVSFARYQSILDSEMAFYQNYHKELYPSYRKQLGKRFLKQLLTVKNKKIAMYTLKRLFSM